MDGETVFNQICERVPDALKRFNVPGVAVGVYSDGREFAAGFGVTSARNPLAVDEKTLFQIGSNTKTFVATMAMRLVEAGKLDLDVPIRKYLPDFRMRDPDATARTTFRHLMTHTGGWVGDYFLDTGDGDDALERYVAAMSELPQLQPFGTLWSYNNASFSLAGHIIAKITGKTFESALKEMVLDPLGLRRSFINPHDVMTHRFAVGHAMLNEQTIVLSPWALPRASWPAGGIAASVSDLIHYGRFHLGDGRSASGDRILSRESLDSMQTTICKGQFDFTMGLSWWLREAGGVKTVLHGGGTYGQISAFNLYPQRDFAYAIFTNAFAGGALILDVTKEPMAEFLGYRDPEPQHVAMSLDQFREYEGRYIGQLGDFILYAKDNDLMFRSESKGGFPTTTTPPEPNPPPTRVAFIAKDRLIALEGPLKDRQIEFLRDDRGALVWMRTGGRLLSLQK
ncbi:MAG TPA: serine hydrolase domain-containing protein [Candidatus Binatus sp.]|nr:serine hydrolase domain-containing protein [Candidatus Binatus sp.]